MSALAKLDKATQLSKCGHWTAGNPLRMVRWVASDFIAQLESRIEEIPGFSNGELAKRLGVSLGRVSQVMNSPGNFTIKNALVYANAVERKVAVVVYSADADSNDAPISGDVFRACWEIAGRPKNMFDIQDNSIGLVAHHGRCGMAAIGHTWGTVADLWNCTAQTDYQHRLIASVPTESSTITSKGTSDHNA
jgi:hypothetical protein